LILPKDASTDAEDCSEDSELEHVVKKRKTSDGTKVNKHQCEPDVNSLIPLAFDRYFEKEKQKNLDTIARWEKIVTDYPNVKKDILTFFQDFIEQNPLNHFRKLCCLDSVKAVLNSQGAYHIMRAIETTGWGEGIIIPESLGALLWIRSLVLEEGSIIDPAIQDFQNKVPLVVMRLTNLVELVIGLNEMRLESLQT